MNTNNYFQYLKVLFILICSVILKLKYFHNFVFEFDKSKFQGQGSSKCFGMACWVNMFEGEMFKERK